MELLILLLGNTELYCFLCVIYRQRFNGRYC